MELKQTLTQNVNLANGILTQQQQQKQPKILIANGHNFLRIQEKNDFIYAERPLVLNAWTQTTFNDYELLKISNEQSTKKELELKQKIRILEENLHSYTQLLSQIHATSSLKNNINVATATTTATTTTTATNQTIESIQPLQQQLQIIERQTAQQHQQKLHIVPILTKKQRSASPKSSTIATPTTTITSTAAAAATNYSENSNSNSNTSIINNEQPLIKTVEYTIITEDTGYETNGEPIHIQLATHEDDTTNLNSSAESGRLEICLTDDNIDIKNEPHNLTSQQCSPISKLEPESPITPPYVKRRKIVAESEPLPLTTSLSASTLTNTSLLKTTTNSNYNFRAAINQQNNPNSNNGGDGGGGGAADNNFINQLATAAFAMSTPITIPNGKAASTSSSSNPNYITGRNRVSLLKTPTINGVGIIDINDRISPNNENSIKIDIENVMVTIGPNNTRIPAKIYENMNWSSASMATRKLLMAIFDRHTLATHSMTGKPSPAFKDHGKPLKQMLDPLIIHDIIFAVTNKCNVSEKEVRNAITTKCADENKMMKMKDRKSAGALREQNKENLN